MAEFLTEATFHAEVDASPLPVLVDFYQDGCMPCRRVAPLVSRAAEQHADTLRVFKVNLGQNPALAAEFGIQVAPTLILFVAGREVARHRGVLDQNGLEQLIAQG